MIDEKCSKILRPHASALGARCVHNLTQCSTVQSPAAHTYTSKTLLHAHTETGRHATPSKRAREEAQMHLSNGKTATHQTFETGHIPRHEWLVNTPD